MPCTSCTLRGRLYGISRALRPVDSPSSQGNHLDDLIDAVNEAVVMSETLLYFGAQMLSQDRPQARMICGHDSTSVWVLDCKEAIKENSTL